MGHSPGYVLLCQTHVIYGVNSVVLESNIDKSGLRKLPGTADEMLLFA